MAKQYGVIHCSDTPPSMDIGAAEIAKWHTDPPPGGNGWSAIGYALVIRRDGTIEAGRDLDKDGDVFDEVGAHAKGFNKNGFGVCLVGGHKGRFDFTWAQIQSLVAAIRACNEENPALEWFGHGDLPGETKLCPAFNVRELLKGAPI
jgi:hypothetical protein